MSEVAGHHDRLPVLCRDDAPGRPFMLLVDYHGDTLLLAATDDPTNYRVGWVYDGFRGRPVDAFANVQQWYGTVPVTRVWPVKRRRRQAFVDRLVVTQAFGRTAICNLPALRRRRIMDMVWGAIGEERI